MKKSNLLVLTAVLILLITLATYNTALKAEYLSGTYKNPYHNFTALTFKNFDAVAINAASEASVTIKQGKTHEVQIQKDFAEYLQIKQNGSTLVVDVNYPKSREIFGSKELVVITLPILKQVTADGQYSVAGKPETLANSKKNQSWTVLKIKDFTQDSLLVEQNHKNTIEVTGNKFTFLRAIAGKNPGSESALIIKNDNVIAQAHLDIRNRGALKLEHIFIPKLSYQFSDSAQLEMSGAALATLKK